MTRKATAWCWVLALLASVPAQAGPVTMAPILTASGGDVQVIFLSKQAGDTDLLGLAGPFAMPPLFCNRSGGGCSKAAPGDMVDLGVLSGNLVFSLTDLTSGDIFFSNMADAAGAYHAKVAADFADLGLGAMKPGAAAAITTMLPGRSILYIGWEDQTAAEWSDFDYNDLVFALVTAPPLEVPPPMVVSEPRDMALFAAGIAAMGLLRRRRRA